MVRLAPSRKTPAAELSARKACSEGVEWARGFATLGELWWACPRGEWMLWALEQEGFSDERTLRLFAVACARRREHLLTDRRIRAALDVAERFANGSAGREELMASRIAAERAAADGARLPDWTAAGAAACAAAVSTARSSALRAAKDAVRHALRSASWGASGAEAWQTESLWQADALRRMIPSGDILQRGFPPVAASP